MSDGDFQSIVEQGMKGRGNPFEPGKLMSNLILAWGCAPSKGVVLDTKMIQSFFANLRDRFDRRTLAVTFPSVLSDMITSAGDE